MASESTAGRKKRKIKRKNFEIKQVEDEGLVTARFATLNVVDFDGDVTRPGAFGTQSAPIVPAHDHRSIPLGKASIYEKDNEALADMQFNLDIQAGRDWYKAIKFDFEKGEPLQEYSYAFDILKRDTGEFQNQQVQFLDELDVVEISPVLRGAGIGTETQTVKEEKKKTTLEDEFKKLESLLAGVSGFTDRVRALAALRAGDDRKLSKAHVGRLEILLKSSQDIERGIKALIEEQGEIEIDPDQLFLQYLENQSRRARSLRYGR